MGYFQKTLLSSLALTILAGKPNAGAADPVQLKISQDRKLAVYQVNEEVNFSVSLKGKNKIPVNSDGTTLRWKLTKDGLPPIREGEVTLQNGTGIITGTLSSPGFLQCEVTGTFEGQNLKGLAGAAVEPLNIVPTQTLPDDFQLFWAEQKAKLDAVPIETKMTPIACAVPELEAFDIQANCLGQPISGYLVRPKEAKSKSLPAILSVHGAGVTSSSLENASTWASLGMLSLDLNAHGLPNGKPQEFYDQLRSGEYKNYRTRGRDSRETTYFLGMFLRVLRGLDFLTTQPEWDGRTLIVRGSSQGGAQAIAAAGLDQRVTFFVAGVPAMCEHSGAIGNQPTGWPKLIPFDAQGKPNPKVTETARYIDMVNFARIATAPAYFTVGFIDTTCPPTTVYAAYNSLRGPKEIFNDIEAGHINRKEAVAHMREAILQHIKGQAQQSATKPSIAKPEQARQGRL